MRISDWSSDVCSSDLLIRRLRQKLRRGHVGREPLLDARVAGESPLRHGDRHALVTGIGSHGVDVGDYKRAQLEEVEKVVEPVRVRTADLHYGQVLAAELRLPGRRLVSLADHGGKQEPLRRARSEEHTSELQSLMRNSYA